jgi:hypothetical protein
LYDGVTGLYNYGYRDYAPELARFTSEDPVRDGANWFAYSSIPYVPTDISYTFPLSLNMTISDGKNYISVDLGIKGFGNDKGSGPSITIQGTSRVGNAEIIAKTAINIAFNMDTFFPSFGFYYSPYAAVFFEYNTSNELKLGLSLDLGAIIGGILLAWKEGVEEDRITIWERRPGYDKDRRDKPK